jgi:death-on-curing protein
VNEPVWILRQALEILHDESLARDGGAEGLRDEGLFESALARPRNLFAYEQENDPFRLAAAYSFGLAKNHPFVDGNKRAAFIAAALFLRLNGFRLKGDEAAAAVMILGLAANDVSESELADWLRANCAPD